MGTPKLMYLIFIESYRAENWDEDVPSREGWQVQCSVHGLISPAGWAYESNRIAQGVATRHQRKHHGMLS